ncbi:MAG: phosphoribosylanthranilate isomerase [Trichocoleus desertorum ATA4-8-CV12]|jgi:phosphoribosylanthranilate isomerase|nr:phosphoribosylanthranilate isomerase [Trichocoleus desertorum ATA4-8-CV12]
MRVKICGITKPEQGRAIAELGATALGFICVDTSPRYVAAEQISQVVEQLPYHPQTGRLVDRIGVFANATVAQISKVVAIGGLNGVQLHGAESPEFCAQVRDALPHIEVIKALRIKSTEALQESAAYYSPVHTLLLDAYHPGMLGGTGVTLDWQSLQQFAPACSWFLAGGLTPNNIAQALAQLQPDGIDLSSGVERSPGDKDLTQVAHLFHQLQEAQKIGAR